MQEIKSGMTYVLMFLGGTTTVPRFIDDDDDDDVRDVPFPMTPRDRIKFNYITMLTSHQFLLWH